MKENATPTILIQNSFCTLQGFPVDIKKSIKDVLTYEDESVKYEIRKMFSLMEYWKRIGKTRGVYAAKAKIGHLKERQIVCWLKGDVFPTGHLPIVLELLEALRFHDFKLDDSRVLPTHASILRWRNVPYVPRYYQKQMIDLGMKHCRGVFESAVGTGKTLVLTYLLKELGVNSLIIVPSVALQEQVERELVQAFGPQKVCSVKTANIKKGKKLAPIRLTTVQTLVSLQKNGILQDLVGDVDLLAVDEIHHSGADSYTQLLPDFDHIYYRFGFTGTFLRNDAKTLDMWGFLSNRLYNYPPYKAREEGFLTPVEFNIETLPGKPHKDYQKEYDANYCVKTVKGRIQGAEELLAAIRRRVEAIPSDEQILILVDRKDNSGKIIHELLKSHGLDNSYVSGDDKKETIADTIEAFNKKEIRILVGSMVIGEGIDLHSAQHLILANGGKSPIKLVQAIGRCVRLHPGKKKSYVWDFCFAETCYLQKHAGQRVEIFNTHFSGDVHWL